MNIVRGKTYPPARVVLFGPSGVGKSTFACSPPGTLALDYEHGLDQIGPDRVDGATNWLDSLKLVREACCEPGDWKNVVVDTVDRLEDQATEFVCTEGKKKSLGDFGYGDGYEALAAKWRELLGVLELARGKGRQVILVAHVQQKMQDDPTLGKYDKLVAALQKKCWGATHRWADAVLFARYEAGLLEGRAIMTGARELCTVADTGFDAKNRWGLPARMPLSWSAYDTAVRASLREPEEIIDSILRIAPTPEHKAKAAEFIQKANGDRSRLVHIETQLMKVSKP